MNCGGVIDGADTVNGEEYVMVLRADFDALQYAMADKSHLLGPVFVNSPRYQGPAVGVKDSEPDISSRFIYPTSSHQPAFAACRFSPPA